MKYIPHKYQQVATDFIKENKHAALLLDCGLGKTVITLTAIADLKPKKTLIIAPLRVARNTWPQEIEKWSHTRHLTYAVACGSAKEREAALAQDVDIHIINRENVSWLANTRNIQYNMIVLDELSSFKSPKSARFKSLKKICPTTDRVVGLTGTPMSNGLIDLWAQFYLLDGGTRLGRSVTAYRDRWFVPEKRSGYIVYTWKPRRGAEEAIYKRISDISLSMKAVDHLDMPERVDVVHRVDMNKGERAVYDIMRHNLVVEHNGHTIDAMSAATLAGKLQQMANGRAYDFVGYMIRLHDRKLDALEDIIESANGRHVLVAYWYKHDLAAIRERFPDAVPLTDDGNIRAWNAGDIQLGLIHPASAGHGLNLQEGGSILVWYGLTWSLELYQQTNARLWRQGQRNRVSVYHIVCSGTIDEDIMLALDRKNVSQERMIEAVKARLEA